MPVYLVSYDLNWPGQDFDRVDAEVNRSPAAHWLMRSTWLVFTHETLVQLNRRLVRSVDNNDRVFVAAVNSCAGWVTAESRKWLEEHLNR